MTLLKSPWNFVLKNVENHLFTLKYDWDISDSLLSFKREYCDFLAKIMVNISSSLMQLRTRKSAIYCCRSLNYKIRQSWQHLTTENQNSESRNFPCFVVLLNVINTMKISLYNLTFLSKTQKNSLIFLSFSNVQK